MTISALVLTKNEEEMIEDCLKQLIFADEIVIVDQNSVDNTLKIAKKYTDRIFKSSANDFAQNRNTLKYLAKGDWLLYVDADERINDQLVNEIRETIKVQKYSAFYFPRKNYILGKWLKHGGWWPDYVPRLFRKKALIGWTGRVHESPKISGDFGYFKNPLVHLSARSLKIMFQKSIKWAKIEAELMSKSKKPKVDIPTVAKAATKEFISSYFGKLGFLDGAVGLIEGIYQALHQSIILTYLWEIQNNFKRKVRHNE